ncbi:MAG: hypothetical protein HWE10_05915 [Gammaproteobacteria bacterium]|nr:hypothetical protein [Gammaproteobacteria bacterium]
MSKTTRVFLVDDVNKDITIYGVSKSDGDIKAIKVNDDWLDYEYFLEAFSPLKVSNIGDFNDQKTPRDLRIGIKRNHGKKWLIRLFLKTYKNQSREYHTTELLEARLLNCNFVEVRYKPASLCHFAKLDIFLAKVCYFNRELFQVIANGGNHKYLDLEPSEVESLIKS